ncbi:30S ribosome-binding factor RbfA [bacterium]|nr:MAG: 30S ribosome-binding factor RbfA [bacterium]
MNQRNHRLSELIYREIGSIILTEMRDPRFKDLTITGVKLNDDLSYAKVYFTIPDHTKIKETAKALNHAQGFFRSKIGERIDIKYIPQIKFYFDESQQNADKIEQIFREIHSEKLNS